MGLHPIIPAMRGFTMIEMVIVMAIAGVLIAIGVPSFNDLVLSTRVKNATSDIYGSLILARSEAIKRNADVTVSPVGGTWATGWTVVASGTTISTQDAVTNVRIECPSGTSCAQTVTYRRDGRLTTATAQFFVDVATPSSPRRVSPRCVVIGISGQINVLADNNLDGNCSNG
jgi:type IV fimbrial biogenesis protein FimT